jgi:hypothetical protein
MVEDVLVKNEAQQKERAKRKREQREREREQAPEYILKFFAPRRHDR